MNFLDDRKIKKIAKDENIKAPNKFYQIYRWNFRKTNR